MEMLRRFRDEHTTKIPDPPRRTVADLLDGAARRRADRERRKAAQRADEFVELLGRESRSSLAWQWSLQGAKAIDVTFKFSRWDRCLMSYDTRER
jgi:hypothetical protein